MPLFVTGKVENESQFEFADLNALPDQVIDVSKEVEGREGHGVRLRNVIDKAGRKPGASHATLTSTDGDFTASVPLDDILESVLVYQLNGEPLPPELGGPIRFLIPNAEVCHTGGADTCANVKFLGSIELTEGKVEDSRDKKEQTPHG